MDLCGGIKYDGFSIDDLYLDIYPKLKMFKTIG